MADGIDDRDGGGTNGGSPLPDADLADRGELTRLLLLLLWLPRVRVPLL